MTRPNQLTVLRIILTPIYLTLLLLDLPWTRLASFIVFIIASFTDWYDGYIARKYGAVTLWGRFLDPLADKILVLSGLFCFSLMGYFPIWMVVVILLRDVIITLFRSYAIFKDKPVTTHVFAKMKTFGQMTTLYIIFVYHLVLKGWPGSANWWIMSGIEVNHLIPILMGLIVLITVVSGLIYLVENRWHIRQMATDMRRLFVRS